MLGIETSCDETAAALVKDGVEIVSNVVASSVAMHKKTGGIIPEQAAREQIKCILPVIEEAMSGYRPEEIDAIAITYGPGLIGSLLVGVETAKTLAYIWKKPIVPVNHLIGHVYANFIEKVQSSKRKAQNQVKSSKLKIKDERLGTKDQIEFPAMVLIVSGGHTELVLMKSHGSFKVAGQTRDDAAGEAFDKIARILGLGYPGGPAIAKAAEIYSSRESELNKDELRSLRNNSSRLRSNYKLPRPMINSGDLDFSFSGLKTAFLRLYQQHCVIPETRSVIRNPGINIIDIDSGSRQGRAGSAGMTKNKDDLINALAYETQEAITDVLVKKTMDAAEKYQVKTIMLAGGVAANKRLREKMVQAVSNTSFWGVNEPTASERLQNQNHPDSGQARMTLSIPPLALCTDNAVSIASAGFFNYKPVDLEKITVEPGLEIV